MEHRVCPEHPIGVIAVLEAADSEQVGRTIGRHVLNGTPKAVVGGVGTPSPLTRKRHVLIVAGRLPARVLPLDEGALWRCRRMDRTCHVGTAETACLADANPNPAAGDVAAHTRRLSPRCGSPRGLPVLAWLPCCVPTAGRGAAPTHTPFLRCPEVWPRIERNGPCRVAARLSRGSGCAAAGWTPARAPHRPPAGSDADPTQCATAVPGAARRHGARSAPRCRIGCSRARVRAWKEGRDAPERHPSAAAALAQRAEPRCRGNLPVQPSWRVRLGRASPPDLPPWPLLCRRPSTAAWSRRARSAG
eukprot:scaffold118611_cov32-Phaeocystis_antarctica.AAC.2